MNCQEYQDDLRIRAQNDDAARQTTQMLEVGAELIHFKHFLLIFEAIEVIETVPTRDGNRKEFP